MTERILHVGSSDANGERQARVKSSEFLRHVVERTKTNGALDFYTEHFTKRGAEKAVRIYKRTGQIRGIRP